MQLITIKKVIVASALMLSQFLTINTVHAGAVHFIDNDTYTTDTLSGLDWRDVTASVRQNYNFVSGQFGVGGIYEGWRYADGNELNKMISNFTGTTYIKNNFTGYEVSPGLIDNLFDLLGFTYRETDGDPGSTLRWINGIISDIPAQQQGRHYVSRIIHNSQTVRTHLDFVSVYYISILNDDSFMIQDRADVAKASFLVRETSYVPVPAAVWFMATGLLGLLEFSRNRMVV